MSEKKSELMNKRSELLAKIAVQREQMYAIQAEFMTPLTLVDNGISAVRFLRSHPLMVGGIAALIAIRRRNLAGLVWGLWRAWKGYREFIAMQAK